MMNAMNIILSKFQRYNSKFVQSCHFAKIYRFPYITQLFIFLGISFDENCCLVSVWYSTWLSEVWYFVHLSKEREIINDKLLLRDSRENIDLWQFAYVDLNKSPLNCNFEKLSSGKFFNTNQLNRIIVAKEEPISNQIYKSCIIKMLCLSEKRKINSKYNLRWKL